MKKKQHKNYQDEDKKYAINKKISSQKKSNSRKTIAMKQMFLYNIL